MNLGSEFHFGVQRPTGQGYFNYPEVGEPSSRTFVSINPERTKQARRESRKMANRAHIEEVGSGFTHQGILRGEDLDRDPNPLPRTPRSQWHNLANLAIGPYKHSTFYRLGHEEWTPANRITTMQNEINAKQVQELVKHPERGSSRRLPPGTEIPYGVRAGPNRTIVIQGNHRVNADIARGRMLVPIRTINMKEPNMEDRLWDTYSDQKEERRRAQEKVGARLRRARAGPINFPGQIKNESPEDRKMRLRKNWGR